jgi:hypothetical protein
MNFYLPVRRRCPAPARGGSTEHRRHALQGEEQGHRRDALRDTKKPLGVSAYRLLEKLPAKLKGSFPTVEELEAELGRKMRPRRVSRCRRETDQSLVVDQH